MVDLVNKGLTALSVAPSAAASLVVPDPSTGIPFTGIGAQAYGFLNTLFNAATARNDNITAPSGVPISNAGDDEQAALLRTFSPMTQLAPAPGPQAGLNLPGVAAVEAAGQRVKDRGDDIFPPTAPQSSGERIAQEAVRGAVSMGVPVPGIAKLPGAIQTAAHILAPGSVLGVGGAVANAIGAATGAAGEVGNQLDSTTPPTSDPASKPVSLTDFSLAPPTPVGVPFKEPQLTDFSIGAPQPSELDALVHKDGDAAVSWGQLFSYGAAAAGVILAHKALNAGMASSIEAARDARYNGGQGLLDADAAGRAAGTIGPGEPLPEVPLPPRNASAIVPDALTSTSLKLRTKFVDKNAQLNAFNDYNAPTPDMAENLRGQTGTLLNEGYVGTRIQHIAETGHDATSNVSMPSPVDAWNRIGAMDDATKQLLSNAEYAADELDSRAIRVRDQNATPNDPNSRVSFGAYDDAQLQKYVTDAYANPDVAYELQENVVRNVRMTELMRDSGMIDSQTAAQFITDHPNYLPSSDASGLIANPLRARDYTNLSGPDAAYVDSWELRKQHFEEIIKAREENTVRANMIQNALDYQNNNPTAPKMVTPRVDANGDPVAGPQSVGYRVGGALQWADINNSTLRNLLDRPPSASGALTRAASQVSAISRSGTTQGIAALGGAFFQAKNAIRSTIRAGVAARPEMYTGYLDRAASQLTGGNLRLPGGLDPTLYAGPVVGTVKNAYGGILNGWLRLLDDSGPLNPFRDTLKSAFGDQGYQAMIDRAKIAYARSTRGQMAEAGALNAVGMGVGEVPTSQLASRSQRYSVLNATAPELFMDKGVLGGVAPKFVRLNNLMQEVASWVGESAHTFHFDLNKNNPALSRIAGADAKRQLAFYTRQLTGDVGQHGSSAAFRDYASISKYMNVSVQDWANLSDAFARAPFRTTLNYATTVGLPLLASVYTAMLAGPAAINHLFNETTNDQRAANIRFYIPGQAPENSPTIPVPQTERFGTTALLQLFADVANLQAHGTNDPTYQWAKSGLEDLFSKHITTASVGGTRAGLADASELILPDALQVGMGAAFGKRISVRPLDPDNKISMPSASTGGEPRQANVVTDSNDINATRSVGKTFWDVMSALFGATGSGVHTDYQAASGRYAATHDPTEAIKAFTQSYAQRSAGAVSFTRGLLWNAPDKLSSGTPLNDSVKLAEDAYRPLLTAKSDVKNAGFTRHGGLELPAAPGATAKVPTDPTMYQLYMTASKLGEKLISAPHAPMKDVQDWTKEIQALPASGRTPADMRVLNNQFVRAREQALQRAAEYVNDGNTALSQIVGKPVDIRKIDWTRGPEQFSAR